MKYGVNNCRYCGRGAMLAEDVSLWSRDVAGGMICPACEEKHCKGSSELERMRVVQGGAEAKSKKLDEILKNHKGDRSHEGDLPAPNDPITSAPCKSCGRENAVRDYGLMCEACQRVTKFSVSATELRRHLEEQKANLDADFARRVKENEEHLDRQRVIQVEHRAWASASERERSKEAEAWSMDRLRNDQLHRLYAMFLGRALEYQETYTSDLSDCRSAHKQARMAQSLFEESLEKTKEAPYEPA